MDLFGIDPTKPSIATPLLYSRFYFSAGEKQIRLPDIRSYERIVIQAFYPTDEQIFEIALLRNAIRNSSSVPVTICLPYLPYSRQDRACSPRESFSLQVLLGTLNLDTQAGDSLVTWDVHSEIASQISNKAGFAPLKNITAEHFIRKYIQSGGELGENTLVVSPDKGARDRAERVHAELNSKYPVINASKVRDPQTGSILETTLSAFYGEEVMAADNTLIVDDICDGGRTFIELAKVIREQLYTESITLYVTHAIFSKGFKVFEEDGKCLINRVISPNFFHTEVPYDTQTEFIQIR